ncbi:MAG: tRNA glutamyl-Q(34) synthetase GluQRS [Pseudomonadota bacterium]
MPANPRTTRFAPSPTGLLHLGHAYSALFAQQAGQPFLLRIDDLDEARCKPEFEVALMEDLRWLGLDWPEPVYRQTDHFDRYRAALNELTERGLTYPCFCSRTQIRAEIAAAPSAPHGPTGPVYPGTCRRLSQQERQARIDDGEPHAWRLDTAKAADQTGSLSWHEAETGTVQSRPELLGDVVLGPKDTVASYHLSVVIDDALQEVGLVTRGQDLLEATHIHRLLQTLLGLPEPAYHHHRLVVGPDGKRLAKRADSVAISAFREAGYTHKQVIDLAFSGQPVGAPEQLVLPTG